MGTTTTCQNRMATFLGKKYATCSPAFFGVIRALNFVPSFLFQPGKPRKSEGWEKIYVASFGAGAFSRFYIGWAISILYFSF